MSLPKFEYLEPKTVEEACSFLSMYKGETALLAGGTTLLERMKRRRVMPRYLIGLKNISHLDYIEYNQVLRIGTLTTLRDIAVSPLIQEKFDLLSEAARFIGGVQIQNMATVGGNLCNVLPADMAPPLMVLGARLRLVGPQGERSVAIEDFFTGPSKRVRKDEVLTEIQVPSPPPRSGSSYLRLNMRTEEDLPLVGVALLLTQDANGIFSEVKIGLGSVSPTPMRAKKTEEFLKGKKMEEGLLEEAAKLAVEETRPPTAKVEYRKEVTGVLVKRALANAMGRIK